MSSPYLFVYGTLRSASGTEWSRRLAANARLVGGGRVNGVLFRLGNYPGLKPAESDNDSVVGELFELSDPAALWKVLDEYEGSDFQRREVSVQMDDGRRLKSWVYYYLGDTSGKSRILSGDWL